MGDPAGIGPEICLRAMSDVSIRACCVPVLFGDLAVLERVSENLHRESKSGPVQDGVLPFKVISSEAWNRSDSITEPTMVDCGAMDLGMLRPGEISPACGQAAFAYIQQAIDAALSGRTAGVVTSPIHKEALRLAGVDYPGHTEIFTALSGAKRSCMMLRSPEITVSMVTTHIGYADVPGKLSLERVLDVIELTAEALHWMLGRAPNLCVCGLNPHAGEHGLFGHREEERLIAPAIELARNRGISVAGPIPPDAAFTPSHRKRFDAFITMYHDQGHIPFKMLAFETGVNITLGLPIVRTSVDHGTAFDIAWRGVADPRSLFAAVHAGAELAAGRAARGISS